MAKTKTKASKDVVQFVETNLDPILVSTLAAAKGVLVASKDGDVYLKPPDTAAAKLLLEYGLGRPTERHEITGKDGTALIPLNEVLTRIANAKQTNGSHDP